MFRASTSTAIDDDVLPRHAPSSNEKPGRPSGPRKVNSKVSPKAHTWTRYISKSNKNHFVAAVGEFVGTVLFLLFAFGGTNVANIPSVSITDNVNTSQLLYISLSFGFSLCVNAWVFFRISGGLFNPAVSLGLALVGAITPLRAAILVVSQLLGGIAGAAIIEAILPGPLYVQTTLSGGCSIAQGLFLEMFLTALLMLTILLLAAEKHRATFLAPVGIGLALFIAEMTGVYYTGGSLNPARSFGPAVVARSFPGYHWIYWLGPALGAALAAGFYKFLKYLEFVVRVSKYEEVVPDQDAEKGYTAGGPTTFDVEATMLANKIKVAEETTAEKVKEHERVLKRTDSMLEAVVPTLSATAVNAAQLAELSAKMDAVIAAMSRTPVDSVPVAELEPAHDAPFTTLIS